MNFNEIKRGHKRQENTEKDLYQVLDSNFVGTLAVNAEGVPMMIPTAYGRDRDILYLHGSTKNHLLNAALLSEKVGFSVHQTDGIVLAQTLFNTSLNYRSVMIIGKAERVEIEEEKMKALELITENIIPGRWKEVETGTEQQLKATMVVKIAIATASVKIRQGGPEGDEDLNKEVWSGHIPIKSIALPPLYDTKRIQEFGENESVEFFYLKHKA